MTINQLRFCLGWLCLNLWLMISPGLAAGALAANNDGLVSTWLADTDADGVTDAADLCPGTPTGTAVNAYGCPLAVAGCDYTTSTVTLTSSGGTAGTTGLTRYVLASNTGTILQINPTASFTGLSGTATYMAVALTYEAPVSNLVVGGPLSAVSASCFDWSDALVFKACVDPPTTCDYQIGQHIVLQAAGGSTGAGVKTSYVLTDAAGLIRQISATPSFASTALSVGTYQAYALTYADDNTVTNLVANGTATIGQVTASCFNLSPPLTLRVCAAPPVTCDYQVGQPIVLQPTGGSTGAGVRTSYVLTDASGKLVRVASTPTFATTGLDPGTYQAYALTYTDDNTIANLVVNGVTTLSAVTASCLAVSPALSITVCGCVTKCLPLVVTRIR
ncbi:hypothetical protein [Fibrella arboris]|uniref:hypothetical protein n=1 Tax=Fibrella arboris TaxID=3242486 RepID=UPI003521246A